jgi:HAD superfamily hydrolase (TIGR01509 family)
LKVPAFAVYLFDVDGTLTNSAPDICAAVQHVVRPRLNGRSVSNEYLTTFIGRHLYDLFAELFPDITQDQMDALTAEYRQIYAARNHNSTVVYPGVAEALAALGGRKSTATTKGTPTTRIVLEKFGLAPYFDHIQGTDGFPAKPAPDVIFKSLEVLEVAPEDCLLVGDAAADMEAGRHAGVKICGVTYGYGDRAEMNQWQPDFWIDDLRELLR